jgi:hypothetical protein
VEPKFQQADRLVGELTRVMLNGKVGLGSRRLNPLPGDVDYTATPAQGHLRRLH